MKSAGAARSATGNPQIGRGLGIGSEAFLPAIDGSAIAFARRERGGVGLYVARDGTSRRLAGAQHAGPGPLTLDLRGRRLAVVWASRDRTRVRLVLRGGRDRG